MALTEGTPDHSTISRNRRLIDIETHQQVFTWMLRVLAQHKLLDGKTIGVDGSTLEENAALRSIVRRDTGERYDEILTRLATDVRHRHADPRRPREARQNPKNKGSNNDWQNPHDPDATITKMKDGCTHLAHKAENAVDMKTGALVAVTLQPANRGDTTSLGETLNQIDANLLALMKVAAAVATTQRACAKGSGGGQGLSQQRSADGLCGEGDSHIHLGPGPQNA